MTRDKFYRLLAISFNVFLFILFFQPFSLEKLDYNNRLLFVIGFGGIVLIVSVFVYLILPLIFKNLSDIKDWSNEEFTISGIIFLVLSSTAFAFYIRYVGKEPITFYVMFKVILVCSLPIIIMAVIVKIKSLEHTVILLEDELKLYLAKYNEKSHVKSEEEIEFVSDNKFNNLRLKPGQILMVKSADNYIEVCYLENDTVERKLIRSTLKNIELQLTEAHDFTRCHRTVIINTKQINRLHRHYGGYSLKLNYLEEKIPVSRQYVTEIKEIVFKSN